MNAMTDELVSRVFAIDDVEDAIEFCFQQGWTDGLPVVPPTAARVRDFLAAGGRPADDVVVRYVDRSRIVTVEKVAINAVLAGCRPSTSRSCWRSWRPWPIRGSGSTPPTPARVGWRSGSW